MKHYIRENFKLILSVTVILFFSVALIGTNEILAQTLPDISEYHIIRCNVEDEDYEFGYTGEEVSPQITRVVLGDKEGNTVVVYEGEITSVNYENNIEIGTSDAEITFEGYRGSLKAKDVFRIVPTSIKDLQVTSASREAIELKWEAVKNADGYLVYRSSDNGVNYELLETIKDKNVLTYKDTDMKFNAMFHYYVSAYANQEKEQFVGLKSNIVEQVTPLAIPEITNGTSVAYNSVLITWNPVDGAVGYQVYKSLTKKGEYKCIAEIKDGTITSYTDAKCECGIEYYYYIKACQSVNEEEFYGEASNIKAVKTLPNRVNLSGATTGGTQVSLKWNASTGAQGYELYKSVGATSAFQLVLKIENTETLSWSETGLDKSTDYYYRIRPYCVVNGTVVYGNYSGVYRKAAVIEYNYTPGSGVDVLRQYAGRKYVYGGASPTSGWDCSGFVHWTYKNHFGISLARTAASQASGGNAVSIGNRSSWKAGDLLFYKGTNGRISHVAVYLGGGQMIHALNKDYGTLIQGVDYYESWDPKTTLVSVRRYLP